MVQLREELSRRKFVVAGAAATAWYALAGAATANAAYQEINVSAGRTLTGRVTFHGTLPKPDEITISKDNTHCGTGSVDPDPVKVNSDSSVHNTVVAIQGISKGKSWQTPHTTPRIIQERCRFVPYIQLAPKRAVLEITNKDPLLHNIHAYEIIGRARRNMFNIAQPAAGQVDKHIMKTRRSNIVEVDCDAHNWMSAWIYLSDHPYVTLSDAKGNFSIADIPAGKFEIIAWHPVLGKAKQTVDIKPGTLPNLDMKLKI